ncbi:uncharacterized protein LOC118740067 [Rhagoletis pomonella]|uniref:uncharacterized protein LOC118740067 n=1 Tax=Rhagoletis pomonella TaxID=28610 RepID=UPI00177BEF49|nr:uncharacterized protein LOC118740067 [Rhagoletis pomonella]
MNLTDCNSPIAPFPPLIIRDYGFDFDCASSDDDPDDNTTLTPLLRRITASPKLLTPKSALASPITTVLATTPTTINGRLAPPQLPEHCGKSPQRRGSPLAGFRRLRSPHSFMRTRLQVPTQCDFGAKNHSSPCSDKGNSKKASNLASRRRCRQLRLKEVQRRYAKPFEVHAVPKPLSPRVGYLLRRVGMIRYRSLFQMEEVDYVVFRTLSERDLQVLGIGDASDRGEILKAVLLADVLITELES